MLCLPTGRTDPCMNREAENASKYPTSPPPSGLSSIPTTASPPEVRSQREGRSQPDARSLPEPRAKQHSIPPQDLDQLQESYASRPISADFSPDKSVQNIIADLEDWARTILRLHRVDAVRHWILKGIAFFAAVTSAAGGTLSMPRMAIGAGIATAIAIAVDAAWPPSGDRNARLRAVHDLRELQHSINLRWEKVRLAHPDPGSIKRVAHALTLLDSAHAKREHIGTYLGEASPAVRN